MAAPLFDVRDALVGEIGERSAQDVLTALKGWLRDGTVVFAHLERAAGIPLLRGAALLLIGDGEVKVRRMLGRFAGLASTHLAFQAVQHPPTDVATLGSVDGGTGSSWAVVRAAPRLVAASGWPALATDLGGLHRRLEHAGWSGIERIGDGAALWHDGRLVAARVGKATDVEALRALRRAAAEESAEITLDPLDGRTAAALHGLAELQRGEGMPAAGLVAEAERTAFVSRGEIDLAVAGACGASGTFVASDRLASAPIRLPDEPAGWESYRYALTLRGRDALNPMTDLWWRFESQYGTRGRALLEAVGKGDPLDQVARGTGTDFDEVRKVVEKWEGDGVVRRG
jgi:hypothetical protein